MHFSLIYNSNKSFLLNQIAKCGANALLSQPSKNKYNIVLTGGTSGPELADCFVRILNIRPILFFLKNSEIHFWLSDERFVERNSDKRNSNFLLNSLNNLSDEYKFFFHEMKSSDNFSIEDARNLYEIELNKTLARDIFDLVILSLSSDGHLASIFSTSNLSEHSSARVEVTQAPIVGSPLRLSLSLSQLAKTKTLIILAYIENPNLRKRKFLNDPLSVVSKLLELVRTNNPKSLILVYTNEKE